jgi:hypothetical protein
MSKRHAVHRLIIFVTAAWRPCGNRDPDDRADITGA